MALKTSDAKRNLIVISSGLTLLLLMATISSFMLFRNLQTRQSTAVVGAGVIQLDNPVNVQDIVLTHINKGETALQAFRGKTIIAFFGYTNCPDICPITLLDLAEIYQEWGEPEDVQIIMITIDAERDTPEVMQTYVENFHPSFLGFSGTDSQIINATKQFFVGFAKQPSGLMLHTDSIFVIDKEGLLQRLYAQDKIEQLATDFKHLSN